MKNCKRLSVVLILVASMFMTGCDASKIMEVITNVAKGVGEAIPKIKEVIDTVGGAVGNANTANTDTNTEQTANNGAAATVNTAGDNEDLTGGTTANGNTAPAGNATTQQAAIGNAIKNLLGSTSFRSAAVDGGNLACAQVVSTALKNAGVLDRVSLNCDQVVADLRGKGWQRVSVPPYQDGDVVTWTTSRGPGRHIGIIVKDGSSYAAISNSSSQRTPRKHAINYLPITQVLRKV